MIKEIFLHKLTRLQQTLQSRFVLDRAPTVVKIKNKKIKKGQKKQKGNDKRNAAAQDTAAPNAAVLRPSAAPASFTFSMCTHFNAVFLLDLFRQFLNIYF